MGRWPAVLVAIAALLCVATTLVFAPGYMSTDSVHQLYQAVGLEPLSDWHPPIMSLLWRLLAHLTGTTAAMAAFQSLLLWAGLLVIAVTVWVVTGSRGASLAVLAVGLLPHVLIYVGVVWKDVQMAFAMLAATAVAVVGARLRPDRRALRWVLFGLGLVFLSYATLVRKNAVFAVVAVFVLLVLALWGRPRRTTWAVAVAAFVGSLAVPMAAISTFAHPMRTSQVTQIMLDDLLHVVPAKDLATAPVAPQLQRQLSTAARRCAQTGSLYNTYWTCWDRPHTNGGLLPVPHKNQITSLWASEMRAHPVGYLEYRTEVFSSLLFRTRYVYVGRMHPNRLGVEVSHPRLDETLRNYAGGAYADLPLLFSGAFWLLAALVLALRPGVGAFARTIRFLGISSAAYVVGYLPITPSDTYRYVYWPAIACTLGLVLYRAGRAAGPTGGRASGAVPLVRPEVVAGSDGRAGHDGSQPAPATVEPASPPPDA